MVIFWEQEVEELFDLEKPYTNAGLRAYFISSPSGPIKIGFHIKGEMGGFWDGKMKYIDGYNILGKDEEILRPISVKIFPHLVSIYFHYMDNVFKIEEFVPKENSCLILNISDVKEDNISIIFHLNFHPIWFSTRGIDELEVKTIDNMFLAREKNYPSTLIIEKYPNPTTYVYFDNKKLKVSLSRGNNIIYLCASHESEENAKKELEAVKDYNSVIKIKNSFISERLKWLEFKEEPLSRFVKYAKLNLLWLLHEEREIGLGLTAGHPDYPWYFGVDTGLSIGGMLYAGLFDEAKASFDIFFNFASRNSWRVPHEIVTNGRIYNPGDLEEGPLLVYSLYKILEFTDDVEFVKKRVDGALAIMFSRDELVPSGPGIMEDEERNTGIKIDVAVFSYLAYNTLSRILTYIGRDDQSKESIGRAKAILNLIEEKFWLETEGIYADTLLNDNRRKFNGHWTSFLPLYARITSQDRARIVINTIFKKLWGKYGIRVENKKETYMPINNLLFAIALINYDYNDLAWEVIKLNLDTLSRFSPVSYPEMFNENGCYLQAWTAAALIESLVKLFTNIEVNQFERTITLKPWLPSTMARIGIRNLRVGKDIINIDIYRDHDTIEYNVSTEKRIYKVI